MISLLAMLNGISFFLMYHDKQSAKKNKRRIPERTLFLSAALFGAFGGTLGMFIFRHKTKHWYFRVFFPLMMLIQAVIVWYIWGGWLQ